MTPVAGATPILRFFEEVDACLERSSSAPALRAALDRLVERLGPPEVVVHNAAVIQWDEFGELSAREHLDAWAVNVGGAITAVSHLAPAMVEVGRGTILLTGGMPTPVPDVTSLSLGKAGLRALTELLSTRLGPAGIHVATVTVAGAVAPGSPFDPDRIAEHYWRLHAQEPDAWEREVVYGGEDVGGDARGQVSDAEAMPAAAPA